MADEDEDAFGDDPIEAAAALGRVARAEGMTAKEAREEYAWRPRGNPNWRRGERGPGQGRPRQKQNTLTREMYDLVLSGAQKLGYDGKGTAGAKGYFTMLAERFPLEYMSIMLAKMMPQKNVADVNVGVSASVRYETLDDVRKDLRELFVPVMGLLTDEGEGLLIEDKNHEPEDQ